jgi:peptidoglycan/xylan/chitin deacetylase (PgdA/CDA1 family)
MKILAKKVLLGSRLLKTLGSLHGRGAAILMYHSVMNDPTSVDDWLGGIVHSTDVFRGQMELLARNYQPLSLDQVKKFAEGNEEVPSRSVVVSFDDGYVDNYEIAAPILNQIGVPAVFYVTVDCVEEGRLPWPARLRFAFRTATRESWCDSSGKNWPLSSSEQREIAYLFSCDQCCKLTGTSQQNYVAEVEEQLNAKVSHESAELMMTYDQIRGLKKQGHIIGSHTMTHPNMAQIKLEDARVEMTESKRRLDQHLNTRVQHFSYPCPALSPHWNSQTLAASREAGYATAVTTDGGLARRGDDLLRLNRIRPTKTVEGLEWNLECAFAGRIV